MNLRAAAGFLMLVAAFALAAWLAWWTVPLLAGVWGLSRPAVRRPILRAALAAALGWAAWLLVAVMQDAPALNRLAGRLALVLQVPVVLLFAATLVFPALLAWSAAALGCGLARLFAPHPGEAS